MMSILFESDVCPHTEFRGLFLKSPGNFSGAESCFVFSVFTVKIEVSIILKIIQ